MTKKILMLCDHPLIPSGVGTQANYLIKGLLETGKYKFFVFGGAMKHPNYNMTVIDSDKFGNDGWIIQPVDGYGDKDKLRKALYEQRPDVLVLITDPRFFTWVWEMEDEIHSICPIIYWHVWDNDPTPKYNSIFYNSTDFISAISLKTYGILQDIGYPKERFNYIPHAVSPDIFKPLTETEQIKFKRDNFGPHANKKFLIFWNNRNARRKVTGDVIASFSMFAKKVGNENVALVMHTSVKDPEGQNIVELARQFDIENSLLISEERLSTEIINKFYNACDCTINISSNEGFGLSTLESLMAGKPIIVHMTGGLQFQIGDWWENIKDFRSQDKLNAISKKKYSFREGKWFGVPVFTSTRSCTGSQAIPYIYDDRVKLEDVSKAMLQLYNTDKNKLRYIGLEASKWAREKFNMNEMISRWDEILQKTIDNNKNTGIRIASI